MESRDELDGKAAEHLLNSVSMLINSSLGCIPVRLIRCLTTPCLIVYIIFSAICPLLGGTNIEGKLYIFRNCSQGTNYYCNDLKCTTIKKSCDLVFEVTVT